ncbi:hypothetical protein VTI74DRAFT_2080 [Chaetomium olivicolor]
MEQDQLQKVCSMREMLREVKTPIMDKSLLDSLGIAIGAPLDVDRATYRDFATSFFRPWVSEDFIRELDEVEGCRDYWKDKYMPKYGCAEWQIPKAKSTWSVDCLFWLRDDEPGIWHPCRADPYSMYEYTGGLELPIRLFMYQNSSRYRGYQSEWVYFSIDENKPHIACFVFDSNEAPGDEILRSEVDYAIELVKYRLQSGEHTNHYTKPVRGTQLSASDITSHPLLSADRHRP